MDRLVPENAERIRAWIAASQYEALDAYLASLHAADIAEVLAALEEPEQEALVKRLGSERAAEVLTETDEQSAQALLERLSDREVAALLEQMPSDDAADILSELPPERSSRLGALLTSEDRDQLTGLMRFEEDTAGGIMEVERAAVREGATIAESMTAARSAAEEVENLQKVYVLDAEGRLTGQLRVLDLIVHPGETPVREVMERNPISVPVDMDQEQVAALFGKYDEFSLPVVDTSGCLVGRITVDDIIDVIEEEASEDIAQIAGTKEEELGEPSVLKVSRARLPWLITGLGGQLLAALLMSRHEASLQTYVVLAFFVPLIVGTAGSIGIQAAVVVVRELAIGHIDLLHTGRRILKELQVAFINGFLLGLLLFALVLAWRRELDLAVLLLGSLLIVIFVAAFIGSSVPLLLHRWRIDPAIATGPFITVANDIVGLAIYLTLASHYITRMR
jgi:magnesium transporter